MKNKKHLMVVLIAVFAIFLSACAGAVTETSAQEADAPSTPDMQAPPSEDNGGQKHGLNDQGRDRRGERNLTAAAETLGVTVEELQQALQDAFPDDCSNDGTDQNGQPARDPNCRPDLTVASETLGVTVEELQSALNSGKDGKRGERDLTAAAEALGVTVEELQAAFDAAKPAECTNGQPSQGVDCRADLDAVAAALDVTVEELEAALPQRGPDFAAAAETLGVTEEELQQALEDSKPAECANAEEGQSKGSNCRTDFEAAAEALGVTLEELQQALGKPEGKRGQGQSQP